MSKRLPKSSENPIAGAIRKAIGAGPDDPVHYTSRPTERLKHWPKVQGAPSGTAEFTKLFELTGAQLRDLGLGAWDGGLFLFPKEWYDHIPNGFPVETINGRILKFKHGDTDNDVGFGCLAYGVRIGPALDDDA